MCRGQGPTTVSGAIEQVSTYRYVDTSKIIVVGYSFGGTGAVNLAMAGHDGIGGSNSNLPSGVLGVVSIDGEITSQYRLSAQTATTRPQLLLESGAQGTTNADIATLLSMCACAVCCPTVLS